MAAYNGWAPSPFHGAFFYSRSGAAIDALLASVQFLTPAWAAALPVALALPVLVHLLGRRTPRRVVFAPTRFVHQAMANRAGGRRLHALLVMLVRIAALSLVVAAFMQPRWYDSNLAPTMSPAQPHHRDADRQSKIHVAIVLDRTASMQRTVQSQTLFERARQQVIDLLGSLDEGHVASVVLLDSQPTALLPEPTQDIALLLDRVAAMTASHEHGRLSDAVRQSLAMHENTPRTEGQAPPALYVHVFSDMQATQFSALPDRVHAYRWQWHPSAGEQANRAIAHLRIHPDRPTVGEQARVTARVTDFAGPGGAVEVWLGVNGRRLTTQAIHLGPNEQANVAFDLSFAHVGSAVVEVGLAAGQGGALAQDNSVGRVVRVDQAQAVHLVTNSHVHDRTSAAYFVWRGLEAAGGFALQLHEPAALSGLADAAEASAEDRRAVYVILEAGSLNASALQAVGRLLDAGRGVLWMIDSEAAADAYGRFARQRSVPVRVDEHAPWRNAPPASVALRGGWFADSPLDVFQGAARGVLLRNRFASHLRGSAAERARVLLWFDDASPALSIDADGRFAIWGAGLSPGDSDFVQSVALVPWLYELVRALGRVDEPQRNPRPGERPQVSDMAEAGQWFDPRGQVWADDRFGETGLYALRDDRAGELLDGVWVELDPAESDLTPANPRKLRDIASAAQQGGGSVVEYGTGAYGERVGPPHVDTGLALWPWLVLGALAALALETGLIILGSANAAPVREARHAH